MLKNLHREVYAQGEVIFREGEPGDCAYLIEEGNVEVCINQTEQINIIGKGELFGEIALLDRQPRTATVRALDNTVLVPIQRTLVNELLEKTDPVIRHLLVTILERFRTQSHQPNFDPSRSTTLKRDSVRGAATQRLRLASDIAYALKNREFEMHYQPICDMQSGQVAGFEALIRWYHPREGVISPMDFLWLAEQTGQIRDLGLWTLEQSCADWPRLRQQTRHAHPFISVNVSPSQLTSERFVDDVKTIITQTGISPRELKLELTETIIINDPELTLQLLQRLADLGSCIALDDFGTGHSGLDSLHRYPIGTMKIDRVFISKMIESPQSREIVETSIRLAHSLGMDVVAEGIETEDVRDKLLTLNCNFGQGWLFGKPSAIKHLV